MTVNIFNKKATTEYDLIYDYQFNSVLNNLNHAMILIDRSGMILYSNESGEKEFNEILKNSPVKECSNVLDVFQNEDKENIKKNIEKVFYGEIVSQMYTYSRNESNKGLFRLIMKPVRNKQGKINIATMEITAIRGNETEEKSTHLSERHYMDILQKQPGLICRIYPEGVISFVNDVYCKYFRKKEKELVGNNLFNLIPVEDRQKLMKKIKALCPDSPFHNYEHKVTDTGNSVRWLMCTAHGIFDENGVLKEIQIEGHDITKQILLESELQKTNQKLKVILEAIPDVVFLYDEHANIVDFYASSSQFNIHRDALIGKNIDMVFPHHVIDTIRENIDKCLATQKLQKNEDWVEIRNNITWYENKYVNVGNTNVLSVSSNITERKKIEEELIYAKNKAEESDRLKIAFLTNISHEIRTPMNAIVGFSDLMFKTDVTKEEVKEYSSVVLSSSKQLLSIFEDIIDISRIESELYPVQHKETELTSVLKQIKLLYSNIAALNDLEIRSFPDPKYEGLTILTDEDKLKQILSNLISNAIKFSKNGSVDFGYLVKNKAIEFFIKDYGIGIPQEYHAIIFDRFRQVKTNTETKCSGTGLGLSIAKSLVETLGGNIWFESQTGIGTQFYFTIPAKNVEILQENKRKDTDLIDKNCWIGKKILVAEDEELNYRLVCGLLKKSGISIVRANNGVEALSIVLSDKPDLVLMDINMPIMNGLRATSAIRKHYPDLPIVALTAYPFTHNLKKATEVGCNDYLVKPVNNKSLLMSLHKYLKSKPTT